MNDTFTNINDISLSSSRKKNFERLIAMLVANSDESVWSTAVDSIHEYYKRAKDDEFIKDLLTGYAADLNEKGDEEEELGKKIKVFVKICQLGIPKLNAFMESLLFTSPILPWQSGRWVKAVPYRTARFGRRSFGAAFPVASIQ